MTEQNPEQQPGQLPTDDPEPTTAPAPDQSEAVAALPLHDAPEDIKEADATGYAVYDRTLGQYLPGVEPGKPTQSKADKRVPEGHTAAVVRV